MIAHQSTICKAVASGTHEVGRILIATGKRQRNPWKLAFVIYPEVGQYGYACIDILSYGSTPLRG